MSPLPLEGIRVADLTVVWAGPFAAALLGDLGAEVIRVESIQRPDAITRTPGDPAAMARHGAELGPDATPFNLSTNFNTVGRNRKSVTMDLARDEGRAAFLRLIQASDVFIENHAPSTVVRLGLDYETLQKLNPSLVMVSASAFGANGPYRDYRAYGATIEAVVGYFLLRGYAEGDALLNTSGGFSDSCGGALLACAVLMALYHRERTGQGQYIDMAQSESVAQTLSQAMMDYALNGRSRRSTGNRDPEHVPQGVYPCAGEDQWVAISCGDEAAFAALCQVIGRPEHVSDPRFAPVRRGEVHDELDADIAAWTREHSAEAAFHVLQAVGVTAAPVLDPAGVARDPHLKAREDWEEVHHRAAGTHAYLRSPIWHFSPEPLPYRNPAPTLGQDNEYVYRDVLGYSAEEYQWFVDNEIAGTTYLRAARRTRD